MSVFNAEAFTSQTVTGEMDTKYPSIPEDEYDAVIKDIIAREFTAQKGPNAGVPGVVMDVLYSLLDADAVLEAVGADPATFSVRQSLFIDFDESGNISFAPGRNVKLGKLREAVGQNTGKAWSPVMLKGAGPVHIKVTERPDPDDAETIYNDVKKVTAG